MIPRLARQALALRRPDGSDDNEPAIKQALAAAEGDYSLASEIELQQAFDTKAAAELHGLPLTPEADAQIATAADALASKESARRFSLRNPAVWAVGLGVLLLAAVLAWQFLGEAGVFPDDAVKIATMGDEAGQDQFEDVDSPVGQLSDWFMLKGFDGFYVPPGFAKFHAAGVRIFKYENESVAQVLVPENTMIFYCFAGQPIGVDVTPEGQWVVSEVGRTVIALRESKGICFMVVFHGTKAQMQRFLDQAQGSPQELALE